MDRQQEDEEDRKWLTLVEAVYKYIKRHPGCCKSDISAQFVGRWYNTDAKAIAAVLKKLIMDGRIACHRGSTYDVLK